jgi:hypothetical protein
MSARVLEYSCIFEEAVSSQGLSVHPPDVAIGDR